MISPTLHEAIDRWIRADTWHTSHPSEEERFYKMLRIAEAEGVRNFYVEHFEEIALDLAEKHHPSVRREFLAEELRSKALEAEAIMSYLAFCGRTHA